MSLLTEIISTTASLVQSYVKYKEKSLLLKIEEQTKRVFLWCCFLTVITLVFLSGIGFIIAGVYTLLASSVGSGYSALILGIIVSLLAAILMVMFKNSMR